MYSVNHCNELNSFFCNNKRDKYCDWTSEDMIYTIIVLLDTLAI